MLMLKFGLSNVYSYNKMGFSTIRTISSNMRSAGTFNTTISRRLSSKGDDTDKLERIYYGPLTPQIRAVKLFTMTSSTAGLISQPIIIREAANIGSTALLAALCSVVGFFTFVTPLLLHFVTKKYVIEIDYDPKTSTYISTTYNFFLYPKKIHFKVEDIEVPDVPGMFTTLNAKKVPLFIDARHFTDPLHYAKMMGYDKPMDFKLGEPESDNIGK